MSWNDRLLPLRISEISPPLKFNKRILIMLPSEIINGLGSKRYIDIISNVTLISGLPFNSISL